MQTDTRRCLIAGVVIVVAAGATQGARALRGGGTQYTPDFSVVPMQVGQFKGHKTPIADSLFQTLAAQAMEERAYQSPTRTVTLSMIYGTDWRSIHAPTGCYPAQGWDIIHDRVEEVPAPPDCPHPGPLHVRVLEATKSTDRELAMYVYARPGATTADWTTHGFRVAMGPRGAGGMIITLRTRLAHGVGESAEAAKTLRQMLVQIYPKAVAFWYTGKHSARSR